jgi:ABC-type branched-subunit amino acid transport system substrate-binding protein
MRSQVKRRRLLPAIVVALAYSLLGLITLAPRAGAEPIKVGAPLPITGPYASDGMVMDQGLRLAIQEVNEQGGLLGRELEIIVFDIGDLTPDKLQAAATNLVDREGVPVLINGYGGMGPDIPAFCPYDIPYIHNDATSNVIELWESMNCTNIFMGADVDFAYGRLIFQMIVDLDYEWPNKKWAIIKGPYDWELNLPQGAREVADQLGGWEVVVEEVVDYGMTEWGAILSKLRQADPALIFIEYLDPVGVKTFIDQFQQNPLKQSLIYIGYTVSIPDFHEVVERGAADGVLGMTLSAHMPDEAGRAFAEKWRAAYGEDPPFSIAAQIYDELMLWVEAVKKVGDVRDFKAINETIRTMAAYEGVTGVFVFNETQYVPTSDETMPTHLLQVQGTEVKQLRVGSTRYADFQVPPWIE